MEKLATARQALASLEAILLEPPPPSSFAMPPSNAFEYTSEAVWKAAREWLKTIELIEENHPRGVLPAPLPHWAD